MKTILTKKEQVKKHLIKRKSITSWDAITMYKATRLADIIFRLRDEGMNIKTEMIYKDGMNFAKYIYKK
jgi:hypothetical protein